MNQNRGRRRRIGSVSETRMHSQQNQVKPINLHATNKDNDDSNDHIRSLKEAPLKRRTWKSTSLEITKQRTSICNNNNNTPPATPSRSNGGCNSPATTTARRSISSDCSAKCLTLSVATTKKARSDSLEGIEKKPDPDPVPGRVKKTRSELCNAILKSGEFDSVVLRKVSSLPSHRRTEKSDEKTEHVDEKLEISDQVKEIVVSVNSKEEEEEDEEVKDGEEEEEEEIEVEKKSVDVKEMNIVESRNRVVDVEVKKYSEFHNRTASSPSSVRTIQPPVIKRATWVPPNPNSNTESFAEEEESFTHSQSKLQSLVDLVMWRETSRSALVFGFGIFLVISSSYANDLSFSFISVVAYMGLVYLGVMFIFKSLIHRGIANEEEEEEEEERRKRVGGREEDVKRMLRLIIPYLNESLLQIRALFSGDPSTTLKMGLALFVLARCGSSITLWNLAKFGFLGAFTIPKIFITYSTHLSAYGKFWLSRFKDAWESCNHKKAVALALFTLVWNLSTVVARVWAAFMLFVALRYYQQKMIYTTEQDDDDGDYDNDEEHVKEEEVEQVHKHKIATDMMMMMPNKLKKIS
ncbi:unnamed protein product [Cochlearia groenlandica]